MCEISHVVNRESAIFHTKAIFPSGVECASRNRGNRMNKYLVGFMGFAIVAVPALAQRSVHVRGYETKSGTHVEPSMRTAPNSTRTDNWSAKGNVNPYNGKVGTVDPYAPKPAPKPRGY